MIEIILLFIFLAFLFHYLKFLNSVKRGLTLLNQPKIKNHAFFPSVSVIIPFRNEEENIIKNLVSLENQDYPHNKFEVIYVDDDSTDQSHDLLTRKVSSINRQVIKVPEGFSPNSRKKRAIRYGIEHSEGDIIVGTDADCLYNKAWLSTLISTFDKNTGFVSAPVSFIAMNGLFERIQQLEFGGLVLTGAGLIGNGTPIICNAANIAYRREVFNRVKGFTDNLDLSSGDDEFLMQKIFQETEWGVKFCLSSDAVVKTNPNKTMSQFYQQRKRWASKGFFYKNKKLIFKLVGIFFFYLSLIVQLILGMVYNSIFLISFLASMGAKMFLEFNILRSGSGLVFEKIKLLDFVIAELIHPFYIIISGLSGVRGNFIWKDRKLKR
ncbi:MAG: glycosyltransferase [Ignavibacteria bacterium]|nr:glycosyltransferase [Ignavibacteria bacterium]